MGYVRLLLVFGFALAVYAEPVGVVTSGGDLSVSGKSLPTTGAPNWPISVGDVLVTGKQGAVITLTDGTVLKLAPMTKVALQQCDRCVAQLFSGSLDFVKPAGSLFEMCALGHPVRPAAATDGTVVVQGPKSVVLKTGGTVTDVSGAKCACNASTAWAATGMSTGAKVAIVAAAGGGATAAGLAVASANSKSSR